MKYALIILTILILATFALSACETDSQISETPVDIIPQTETTAPIIKEQSQVPYLGIEEITPLFVGRNTIRDWIKDINASDVEYIFFIEGATGDMRLDIRCTSEIEYNIASFYVEENTFVDFLNNDSDGIFKILPDEAIALQVIEVISLDFEKMGIPYNIRGITKGSSAEHVKMAFLDMKREIDFTGVPFQELYNIRDVDPIAKIEPYYENFIFLGGMDSIFLDQRGFREITYFHTIPNDIDNVNYSIYHSQTVITFSIDEGEKVVGFRYADMTNRN